MSFQSTLHVLHVVGVINLHSQSSRVKSYCSVTNPDQRDLKLIAPSCNLVFIVLWAINISKLDGWGWKKGEVRLFTMYCSQKESKMLVSPVNKRIIDPYLEVHLPIYNSSFVKKQQTKNNFCTVKARRKKKKKEDSFVKY